MLLCGRGGLDFFNTLSEWMKSSDALISFSFLYTLTLRKVIIVQGMAPCTRNCQTLVIA